MRVELGSEHYAKLAAEAARHISWLQNYAFVEDVRFEQLGSGAFRRAMLAPDGVVYKAPRDDAWHTSHFQEELELFDQLNKLAVPWCPDYFPYLKHGVMAMRRYQPVTSGWSYNGVDQATLEEMESVCYDIKPDNLGLAEDGRAVLLDGGCVTDTSYIREKYGSGAKPPDPVPPRWGVVAL